MEISETVKDTFHQIDRSSSKLRKELIEEALRHGNDPMKLEAVNKLLDDNSTTSWRTVIKEYPSLPVEAKEKIAGRLPRWYSVSEQLVDRVIQPETSNILKIIRKSKSQKAASLAVKAIKEGDDELKKEGVNAFLEHLKLFLGAGDENKKPPQIHSSTKWYYIERVLEVMADYRTVSDPRLLKRLLDLGHQAHSPLRHILNVESHPAHSDLKMVLRYYDGPGVVDFLMKIYRSGTKDQREWVQKILDERPSAELAEMLAEFFRSTRHEALSAIAVQTDSLDWLKQILQFKGKMNSRVARKLLRFVKKTNVDETEKKHLHLKLLDHQEPSVRRVVLEEFDYRITNEDLDFLRDRVQDETHRDVLKEYMEFGDLLHGEQRQKWLYTLLGTANQEIREQAASSLSNRRFQQLMESFEHMDENAIEMVLKSLKRMDPNMTQRIGEELQSLNRERRIKAIQLIEKTEMTDEFEEQMYELINDPDRRVRAAVVRAIGLIGSPQAIRVLIKALSDDHRRTRANAIEAFEEIGHPKLARVLIPFLQDPDNRVRANAAKALWNLGKSEDKAAGTLEKMLDEKVPMKLSAIWAIGEIRYTPAKEKIKELAENDPNEKIRQQATQTLKILMSSESPSES